MLLNTTKTNYQISIQSSTAVKYNKIIAQTQNYKYIEVISDKKLTCRKYTDITEKA
jgi:hypothetical protein